MSKLQTYLQAGGTPTSLTDKFAIYVTPHPKYPHLFQFKYNQIKSPMDNPIVRECRGCILDSKENWAYVARPFDKFSNIEEPTADAIDWNTAKAMEKLDGSLMVVYFYDGVWQVATSGSPDASGPVGNCDFTFAELFYKVWFENNYMTPDKYMLTSSTYLFELTTPFNQIIVRHPESKITMIGCRNLKGFETMPFSTHKGMPPQVKLFNLQSLEEIQSTFGTMDPFAQEGYVVVDRLMRRVKIKHPGYVKYHHMKDKLSPKNMLDIIRKGEAQEVLSYFPEFKPIYDGVSVKFNQMISEIEQTYETYRHIEDRKEFALTIQHYKLKSCLFSLKSGQYKTAGEWAADQVLDNIYEAVGL